MKRPTDQTFDPTRRDFLKAAGVVLGSTLLPGALRAADGGVVKPRPFEVGASLYAWELHDEGVEKVLDNVQQMSGVNSVYLLGLMHPERRPFASGTFPHNPVRKTWMAEDARVYWHPEMKRYGRIKPRLSDNDWLNQTDWARTLIDAARKRGLRTGIECSHALVDKERAEGEFADVAERDIHGNITSVRTWLRPLCPNNPATVEYACALYADLAANYDVDYLMSCIVSFDEGGAAKGGCFCDACKKAATETGFDLGRAQKILLANPTAQPELGDWQKFRYASAARFYKAIQATIRPLKPKVDFRYNLHMKNPADWGIHLPTLKPHLNSVRIMDYTEQEGNAAAMPTKRQWLTELRGQLGPEFPMVSAVAVRLRATPELIREGVGIAVGCGMNGVTLGHYDGAEFPMLRAIREGLAAAKVDVQPRWQE